MKIVVKIGGAALEDKTTLAQVRAGGGRTGRDGHKVAVVHGGGSALYAHAETIGQAE